MTDLIMTGDQVEAVAYISTRNKGRLGVRVETTNLGTGSTIAVTALGARARSYLVSGAGGIVELINDKMMFVDWREEQS